jgi:hypothetical protein
VLEVHERAGRPEATAELLARDQLTRALQERAQHDERLLLQHHHRLAIPQLPRLRVEGQPREVKDHVFSLTRRPHSV